ncbi:MAG TPA: hypothetical protein VGC79_10605 [Polyangiaceae bacterium]
MAKLDIFIADEGKIYSLPQADWMKEEFKIAREFAGDAAVLVKRGALLADVPIPEIPVGFFCWLVNLAQLNDAEPILEQPDINPDIEDPDEDTLLVHVLPDDYYAVPKDVWSAKTTSGNPGTNIICAEQDDGFFVNLPRIRNKQKAEAITALRKDKASGKAAAE